MSPPNIGCKVPVIPTFLSTDLTTPGALNRETLPAIGFHTRDPRKSKLWGHETKVTSNGELAYSCFKPSHLCAENVVVTHRHHGNRISFIDAKDQPYNVTSLMLSKCRINDQCMPPPMHSHLPQKYFIEEPCPDYLRNSYFSHRCKFQVFPTNGVDLRDAAEPPGNSLNKKQSTLSSNTRHTLSDIHDQLYRTTTYQKNFPQHFNMRKRRIHNTCLDCLNKMKNPKSAKYGTDRLLQRPRVEKHPQTAKTENAWPSWPLGVNNITNNPPGYPKIKLPKYSYKTALSRNNVCLSCHCNMYKNGVPKDLDDTELCESETDCLTRCHQFREHEEMENESGYFPCNENISNGECSNDAQYDGKESSYITDGNNDIDNSDNLNNADTRDEPLPTVPEEEEHEEEHEIESACCELKSPEISHLETLDLNQRLYHLIVSKAKQRFDYENGFKTEAHRRYHERYPDKLPDLRDADTEGRRHHYCGINVHLFRG